MRMTHVDFQDKLLDQIQVTVTNVGSRSINTVLLFEALKSKNHVTRLESKCSSCSKLPLDNLWKKGEKIN